MNSNKLKLNPSTFKVPGTSAIQWRIELLFPIHILVEKFEAAKLGLNLSVIFDCDFSLKEQVDAVCRSCFVGLCYLQGIKQYLGGHLSSKCSCQ